MTKGRFKLKELYGIKGNIIYTKIFGKYEVINNGIIVVEDERVKGVYNELPALSTGQKISH